MPTPGGRWAPCPQSPRGGAFPPLGKRSGLPAGVAQNSGERRSGLDRSPVEPRPQRGHGFHPSRENAGGPRNP
eukprot:15468304-Alexandrium_andersonii.AAC.1